MRSTPRGRRKRLTPLVFEGTPTVFTPTPRPGRPRPQETARAPLDQRPKVVVCGSRTFTDRAFLFATLDKVLCRLEDPVVVSGGARGVDRMGEDWASLHWLTVLQFLPDYHRYGKGAPLKRNVEMAQAADYCVAFHDGESPGTAHMVDTARQFGLVTKVFYFGG